MNKRQRIYTVCVLGAVAVVTAMVAGCGAGGGSSPATIFITNLQAITPLGWSSTGGNVTIRADVTASKGVNIVQAQVTLPDGTKSPVPMALKSGSTYEGTYAAPLNSSKTAKTYQVKVTASDLSGATADSSQFVFQVPGMDGPPPPPF
jgi:hypothetical protein